MGGSIVSSSCQTLDQLMRLKLTVSWAGVVEVVPLGEYLIAAGSGVDGVQFQFVCVVDTRSPHSIRPLFPEAKTLISILQERWLITILW